MITMAQIKDSITHSDFTYEEQFIRFLSETGHTFEVPEGTEPYEHSIHFKCTCCGKEFYGMGNNPLPLTEETLDIYDGPRACNECDRNYVIPARFALSKIGFDYL